MIAKLISQLKGPNGNHALQRDARLKLSMVTSVLAKFVSIGATLITIPVTLNYLGAESFGVWMVISGVVGFLGFTDLGIGTGLQNALSKAYGKDDFISPKHYVVNAYFIVTALVLSLVFLMVAAFALLPVDGLFKISDRNLLTNAVLALKYSVFAFLLGVPIALIQRVLGGIQKTYVASSVMLAGSVLSILAIFLAVYFDLGLIGISLLFVLSPTVALFIYSLYFFYSNEAYRPRLCNLSKGYVKPIISAGIWTVFVQITYALKMNVPTLIISSSLGLLAVAEYSVTQKLIGFASVTIGIALQPLWVVYGEAYHRGDRVWVERTLRKSIKLVLLLTVPAAIAFQFLGQPLVSLWLGGDVLPSRLLIGCFSLWMIASTINTCFAMLINGTGNFKHQAIYSAICVGSALALAGAFVETMGAVGVILVIFLVAEVLRVPMNYINAKQIMSRL